MTVSLKLINHNTKVEENISNKCGANVLIHKGYLKIKTQTGNGEELHKFISMSKL